MNLGPVVSSAANDQHPTISKDGLTLIFVSTRPGGMGGNDLWVAQRDSLEDSWSVPANLSMLNTSFSDFAPELSTDGHRLYFHSDRPGGCGNTDIYAVRRQNKRDDFGWRQPINLGGILNTPAQDGGPTAFRICPPAFSRLHQPQFQSCGPGKLRHLLKYVCADISACNGDHLWSDAFIVNELNSPLRDTRTAIRRRDGLEMIVTSGRGGGCGGQDLWVSTRATTADDWSIPVNLDPINPSTGTPICVTNSAAVDGAMALSWDGTELIFFSNRPGGSGGNDLWVAKRTKLTGQQ